MPPHPLINLEIQNYCQDDAQLSLQNEPKFNGVYSRNNLPKIKDGTYLINFDEHESIGTHWIAFYVDNNNSVNYFDSYVVEHILKEITKFVGSKNFITNVYRYISI